MDAPRRPRTIAAAGLAVALAAAALALLAGGEGAPASPAENEADVLVWKDGTLRAADPATLRGRGRALPIDLGPTAFSRDGDKLAVAAMQTPLVRLVDLRRMRVVGRPIELGRNALVDTMQWLDATTLAVVTWGAPPQLYLVDVVKQRVVRQRALPGNVFARATARGALVLLTGPSDRIGPSTLVIVDARGVRTVSLPEVASGFSPAGDPQRPEHRRVAPGLAVDPAGRRAVVVPAGGRVAEIDLASGAVSYHELSRPASLFGRLRAWLEPTAHAKSVVGPERQAVWVGERSVAVVALEHAGIHAKSGEHRQLARPVAVELIDTRGWTVRTLSRRAGAVAVTRETLLVYGGPFSAGGSFSADEGEPVTGVDGFTAGGGERFRVLGSRHVGHVQTAGRYAYATSAAAAIDVIDTASGRVVRSVRRPARLAIVVR